MIEFEKSRLYYNNDGNKENYDNTFKKQEDLIKQRKNKYLWMFQEIIHIRI